MKPKLSLRVAAILTFVHALLHTFGGLLHAPSHGSDEVAVIESMRAFRFETMGTTTTYWDFYFGFGLFLTVSLLALSVILWQLATLFSEAQPKLRPLLVSLFFAFLLFAVLSIRYFFIAPVIVEVAIAAFIGLAYVYSRPAS